MLTLEPDSSEHSQLVIQMIGGLKKEKSLDPKL